MRMMYDRLKQFLIEETANDINNYSLFAQNTGNVEFFEKIINGKGN